MIDSIARSRPTWAIRRVIVGIAFWTAVGLPIVYLPALLGGPLQLDTRTLIGLLGVHAVAVVVGHGYGAERER